jgi:hypothetical protein
LTIDQASTGTAVSIAPASVTYGAESAVVVTATVTPQYAGAPSGTVTVTTEVDGSPLTLCTITLSAATGTCSPGDLSLPPGGPYPTTAIYNGDADFTGSTDASPTGLSVGQAGTATTITSLSPGTVAFGSESQVTATAEITPDTSGTPTGNVVFTTSVSGSPVTLCTGTVAQPGGVGTPYLAECDLADAALPASSTSYDVTATYSGDADFTSSSTTSPTALAVTAPTTTTTVTSVAQTTTYGDEQTAILSASVTSSASVAVPGDVTFQAGGTGQSITLCQAPVVAGAATCSVPDTALDASAAPYSVIASASGDADFQSSADTLPSALTVSAASTSTILSSVVPASVKFGTAGPAVHVEVNPQFSGSPTGTVSVEAVDTSAPGSATLCTVTLTAGASGQPGSGSCTAATVALAPGIYDLELSYIPGTPNFTASNASVPFSLTVTSDSTSVVITSVAPTSVPIGNEGSVAVGIAVTPGSPGAGAPAPTGTVTVTTEVNGVTVTVCTVTLPHGAATGICHPTSSALSVGTHALVATYSGDANYVGSVSTGSTLTVTEAAATVDLTSSASPSLPGRPVTFTATVASIAPGFPAPTGTVQFTDPTSGATLCSAAPISRDGGAVIAACTVILPTTPTQQIRAGYSGDGIFAAAQGAFTQQIEHGYWTAARDGGVFAFGDAHFYGSMGGKPLNQPIVGMAATADADGYWLVASDGGIFAFGDAQFYGSMGHQHLNEPVVGMQPTRDGKGYWLVASDGGIFNYGDAQFYGSTGNLHLNSPIVGMVATSDGLGYFLVAADGGVFAFGDARFAGGGNPNSDSPIVGLSPTPSGGGYWLAAANGGVFSYGDAQFHGSMINQHLVSPIVGTASTTDGGGYWLVASDGGIFAFGDAIYDGSTGNERLNSPMIAMADI